MRSIESFPGWRGRIDHMQAEDLLIHKKTGTYVLRYGDSITEEVEKNLADANHRDIHCFILTVVEENDKMEDILIILMDRKWLLYHDDPDLIHIPYPQFSSLQKLLNFLKTKAKYPL